jgi:hypothetical protein
MPERGESGGVLAFGGFGPVEDCEISKDNILENYDTNERPLAFR